MSILKMKEIKVNDISNSYDLDVFYGGGCGGLCDGIVCTPGGLCDGLN